jgi:uncharacterized protein YkwD
MKRIATIIVALGALSSLAQAQCIKCGRKCEACPGISQFIATAATDPTGYQSFLNQTRTQVGLRPLVYDANLARSAQANNSWQSQYGMGHWLQCGAGQCVASGQPTSKAVHDAWLASPPHRAILLTPTATQFGISFDGRNWTLNVR